MSAIDFRDPTESCTLTIRVTPRVYAALAAKARALGMTASVYAGLLFHAGWAARCGRGADDAELMAAVDAIDARRSPAGRAAAAAPRPAPERWLPVPVLVPIAVPIAVAAPSEPLAVHITGSQPITAEASEHLATLIGAAITKFDPVPVPRRTRRALDRAIRALAACGNDAVEIAQELECSPDEVRETMGWVG